MAVVIDASKFYEISNQLMDGSVKYLLGGKANIHKEPDSIKQIDCSGFVQYVVYKATNEAINFQGGSVWQREKCDKLNLEKIDYSTCNEIDGWLRIAFMKKSKTVKVGHVWLIHNGFTHESYGGHGPGRRFWSTKKLKDNVYACYKLAQLHSMNIQVMGGY